MPKPKEQPPTVTEKDLADALQTMLECNKSISAYGHGRVMLYKPSPKVAKCIQTLTFWGMQNNGEDQV